MANVPPPMMDYRTPAGLAPTMGAVYREGDLIVGPRIVRLPEGCVKCGGPEARVFAKTLHWHHPAVFLAVLFNVLIYVVIALIVRKGGEVTFGLCAEHAMRRVRRMEIAGAACLAFVSVPIVFYGKASRTVADDFGTLAVIVGVIGAGASLIVLIRAHAVLRPKRIDDHQIKLAGAGQAYLRIVERSEAEVLTAMPVR
jgi:hypothetical protein